VVYRPVSGVRMMRQISVSENTFRKLIELKNHWSFQHRTVTNKDVLQELDRIKMEIYGYDSKTPVEKIEEISNKKTKEKLIEEMDAFSKAYNKLLVSGYDFEPGYTIDEHIKTMIKAIEEGVVAPPV